MSTSSWLDEHLETFVRPYLGYVPNVDIKNSWYHMWARGYHKKSLPCLYITWAALKKHAEAKKKVLMFPGRDMWEMEILARMENYPTIFRPDISTNTMDMIGDIYRDHLIVDTGYAGSTPKALKAEDWLLIWHSDETQQSKKRQIFPRALGQIEDPETGSILRNPSPVLYVACLMESSPKYWQRGSLKIDPQTNMVEYPLQTEQKFNPISEFSLAAQLTQWIAKKGNI